MSEIVDEVKASSFTLCDDDGNARAGLRLRNGEPSFEILDDEGRVRASLSVDGDGNPSFLLAGAEGIARIGMDCSDDGPSFFVRDSSGALRIGLDYTEETGTAVVVLVSEGEQARLSLTCSSDDNSVRVSLMDGSDRCRIEMRSQDDAHSLSFYKEDGSVERLIAGNSLGSTLQQRCVILKPFPVPSWKKICAVSVFGFYAMPGLNQEARSNYLRRIGDCAHALLEFVRKDVARDAKLEWETGERTLEQMVEMDGTLDVDSTWAVLVGVKVEFSGGKARADVADSFSSAWIPRFSSAMQFHVPFDDPPNLPILDGYPNGALVLQR